MPIKVVDPDTSAETEAFTAEEFAAKTKEIEDAAAKKIADNEEHMKQKLNEFQQGKTATELEKEAEKAKTASEIAEARRIANEAAATVASSEARRLETLKKVAMEKFVGTDPELVKKFEESWALVNFDTKEEADFLKKAEMVANMIGMNSAPNMGAGGMSFGGAHAPGFQPAKKEMDSAAHQTFRDALPGMNDFLAKPKDEQK